MQQFDARLSAAHDIDLRTVQPDTLSATTSPWSQITDNKVAARLIRALSRNETGQATFQKRMAMVREFVLGVSLALRRAGLATCY